LWLSGRLLHPGRAMGVSDTVAYLTNKAYGYPNRGDARRIPDVGHAGMLCVCVCVCGCLFVCEGVHIYVYVCICICICGECN
jgi:hypothetical protein